MVVVGVRGTSTQARLNRGTHMQHGPYIFISRGKRSVWSLELLNYPDWVAVGAALGCRVGGEEGLKQVEAPPRVL